MFEEYDYWRKRGGRRGFIEFKFYYWEHLFNAISAIEELPVYQEKTFVAMPGTPSYVPSSAKQLTLPLRKIPSEACVNFHEVRFFKLPESIYFFRVAKVHQGRTRLYALYGKPFETEPSASSEGRDGG